MDFDHTIDYMTMVGMTVDLVRKIEEFVQTDTANFEKYSGANIPNAPVSLDGDNVKLTFQFKMLRRW